MLKLGRGSALFKSDNISTIAVLKNFISNCCMKRNMREDITYDVPEDSCMTSFQLLKDKFKCEYQRKKEIDIKKAISSLDLDTNTLNDVTMPVLCEDYQRIWKISDDNSSETNFDQLVETIAKWYIDWCKLSLNGIYFNNELIKLQSALKDCQLNEVEKILSFKHKSSPNTINNYH